MLCSWARHFTLTVPLSTQEYKWVPAICQGNLTKCWGVTCDGLAVHPGEVSILLVASCYKNQISSSSYTSWARDLTFLLSLLDISLHALAGVNMGYGETRNLKEKVVGREGGCISPFSFAFLASLIPPCLCQQT